VPGQVGLRSGDVVVAVDSKPVADAGSLRNTIGMLRIGTEVKLDILRDGKELSVLAVIAKPKQEKVKASKLSGRLAGAELGRIESDHPLAGQVEGVEVIGVERGSAAWMAGLRKGDIIVSVNREPVKNTEEFRAAVEGARGPLLLLIRPINKRLMTKVSEFIFPCNVCARP